MRAFCSILGMRGSFRSRRFGSIIEEARQLAKDGVKEIVLIAQISSRYGEDLGEVDALAALIRALGEVDISTGSVRCIPDAHLGRFSRRSARRTKPQNISITPLQHASRNVR